MCILGSNLQKIICYLWPHCTNTHKQKMPTIPLPHCPSHSVHCISVFGCSSVRMWVQDHRFQINAIFYFYTFRAPSEAPINFFISIMYKISRKVQFSVLFSSFWLWFCHVMPWIALDWICHHVISDKAKIYLIAFQSSGNVAAKDSLFFHLFGINIICLPI